jgi:DUF971 family protein
MVSRIVDQLAVGTAWGDIDYLILDMPPGTGDIQLTLCQTLSIAAAVIVTTPQKLAFVDVVKGIEMFDKLKVPTVAVVENMSYFDCDAGKRYRPFGKGHLGLLQELAQETGQKPVGGFELPMSADISAGSDGGRPIAVAAPASEVALVYRSLAETVDKHIAGIKEGARGAKPSVTYQAKRGIVARYMTEDIVEELILPARVTRMSCRCALCVNEVTGENMIDGDSVPLTVEPILIQHKGNYAVEVKWSDGHESIFPYDAIPAIAQAASRMR